MHKIGPVRNYIGQDGSGNNLYEITYNTWYGIYHPHRPNYLSWIADVGLASICENASTLPDLTPAPDNNWANQLQISGITIYPIPSASSSLNFRGFGMSSLADYGSIAYCAHPGFDFVPANLTNRSVLSITNGIVVGMGNDEDFGSLNPASWGATTGGYNLVIRVGGHFLLYGHLGFIHESLYIGKRVQVGDFLGTLALQGTSGENTHLHLEIRTYASNITMSDVVRPEFGAIRGESLIKPLQATDPIAYIPNLQVGSVSTATSTESCSGGYTYEINTGAQFDGNTFNYLARQDLIDKCFNMNTGAIQEASECINSN